MWHLGNQEIGEVDAPFVFFALLFTILSFLAVAGRVYTRLRISREIGVDDYFIVGAEICHIIAQVCNLYQLSLGLGDPQHVEQGLGVGDDPWLQMQINFLGTLYGSLVTYQGAQVFVKVSVIFQYRRLFTTWQAQKTTFYLLVWMVVYGLGSILLSLLHCWPISNFWSTSIRTGCAPLTVVSVSLTIVNVITNFAVWVFPLLYIIPLRLARQQDKYRLIILFALGLVPEFLGFGRLGALSSFVKLDFPHQIVSKDAITLNIMGSLEIATAIIIASLPALIPLFRLAGDLLTGRSPRNIRGRRLGRAPPNRHSRSIQPTPARSNGFARHLEGLESGESILLDEYLPRPTPTRARGTNSNASPARPPRTPTSQHTDTIQEPPSPPLVPITPITSAISDTPPRLDVRVDATSFISDALPGLDAHVHVDSSRALDTESRYRLDPRDRKFGSKVTITGGEAAK